MKIEKYYILMEGKYVVCEDDLPYEDWTWWFPQESPSWDDEKMAIYYKVSGAIKPARLHLGRWYYRKDASTWKKCGMKKNLLLRTCCLVYINN